MEESQFIWVGGLRCLDFVNTEKISQGERVDLIAQATDLLGWLAEAKLLSQEEIAQITLIWQQNPEEERRLLHAVHSLRLRLRELLQDIIGQKPISEETLGLLNACLSLRQVTPQIIKQGDGIFTERFAETGESSVSSRVLGRLAQTASDLLCRADISQIRRCENPQCILFFYDTSKNHTRRWCSMNWCGNRAKAATHYKKKITAM